MARRRNGTRKSGFISFLWNPFRHMFIATGESAQKVGTTAGKIVKNTVGAVEGVGTSFAKHSNQAIRGITRRKGRRANRRSSRSSRSSRHH